MIAKRPEDRPIPDGHGFTSRTTTMTARYSAGTRRGIATVSRMFGPAGMLGAGAEQRTIHYSGTLTVVSRWMRPLRDPVMRSYVPTRASLRRLRRLARAIRSA